MFRFVLMYVGIHVNVLLVSLFLLGRVDENLLLIFQFFVLILVVWEWKRFGKCLGTCSWKKRCCWFLISLGLMVGLASIVSIWFSGLESNQKTLLTVQNQVPFVSFMFFLLNASLLEEFFYRELLWEKLFFPLVQLVVTSFLFALAHHPSSLVSIILYGGLGALLGLARVETDCLTSTMIHLAWNGLVCFLSYL